MKNVRAINTDSTYAISQSGVQHRMKPLSITGCTLLEPVMRTVNRQKFNIRLARGDEPLTRIGVLIQKACACGQPAATHFGRTLTQISFAVLLDESRVGGATLVLDSSAGLDADCLYKKELDQLRQKGRKICELTKVMFDDSIRSKKVLASLFHMTYIQARYLHGCSDLLIEVNPRHMMFYMKNLGFMPYGEARYCTLAKTQAVLLRIEVDYIDIHIRKYAGRQESEACDKPLYRYFFSKAEEAGIAARFNQADLTPRAAHQSTQTFGERIQQMFSPMVAFG
jgi:hypothetical protein